MDKSKLRNIEKAIRELMYVEKFCEAILQTIKPAQELLTEEFQAMEMGFLDTHYSDDDKLLRGED